MADLGAIGVTRQGHYMVTFPYNPATLEAIAGKYRRGFFPRHDVNLFGFSGVHSDESYGSLSGAVTENGVPVPQCKVFIYERVTGKLVDKVWTGDTGLFTSTAKLDSSGPYYFAVAIDRDDGVNYNALIFDRLQPQ